jgi:hypothetical protein
MRRAISHLLAGVLLYTGARLHAQVPVLTRYIPGNYLTDQSHRVELANPGAQTLSLGGYLLVTRDYSVRLPASARIPARGSLQIGRDPAPGVGLSLSRTPDFLIRFHFLEHEGQYIALFDPAMRLLEAAYFSPSANVPFLPDRDTCITMDGTRIPFILPPENRPVWQYVRTNSGKVGGFTKQEGKWVMQSMVVAVPPSTEYGDLQLRYQDGIMTIKWMTNFEQGCSRHVIERCQDQASFLPVGEMDGGGDSQSGRTYSFLEQGLQPGGRYYYRIKGEDASGNPVFSPIKEVVAEEVREPFLLEVVTGDVQTDHGLSIRFSSVRPQNVRIKLFDEQLQEVAFLYDDHAFGGVPVLIRVGKRLEPGKRYLVMATTDGGRYGVEFTAGQ